MNLYKKIPAGALLLTIIMALIFSVLCSSLVLIGYFNRQGQQIVELRQKLRRNAESAINLVLSDTVFHAYNRQAIDLFQSGSDSVNISSGAWGLLKYGTIRSFRNNSSVNRSFFYGAALPDYMNACVYLADHQRSLALVGSTRLTGDIYLSKAGIKAGYIDQRGYDGDKLVMGNMKLSADSLPSLDSNAVHYLFGLLNDTAIHSSNFTLTAGDPVTRSFFDSAFIFSRPDKLVLENEDLAGHIIICSAKEIEIGPSARLENILLVAPSIRFKSNFKGMVQAIATDSLVVEPGCEFNYPSAMVLLKTGGEHLQNVLRIGQGCRIDGFVVTCADNKDLYKSSIEIGHNATVTGIVYTMGYLSLKGNVNGVVLTDYFLYRSPATVYENHLVDVAIRRDQLSPYFAGSSFFSQSASQKIISWLK